METRGATSRVRAVENTRQSIPRRFAKPVMNGPGLSGVLRVVCVIVRALMARTSADVRGVLGPDGFFLYRDAEL